QADNQFPVFFNVDGIFRLLFRFGRFIGTEFAWFILRLIRFHQFPPSVSASAAGGTIAWLSPSGKYFIVPPSSFMMYNFALGRTVSNVSRMRRCLVTSGLDSYSANSLSKTATSPRACSTLATFCPSARE